MADQSPEQEASYPLGQDLPRSDLSPAAQLEYDRLKPGWERDAAWRERDAELVAQRKLHTVDRSGTTHIFRYRPFRRLFIGIIIAGGGAYCIAKAVRSLSNGTDRWWSVILLITVIGVLLSLVRMPFEEVRLSDGKMIIRNIGRRRVINASEIRAITLEYKVSGAGGYWEPKVHLTNGRSIWLKGFSTSVAGTPDPKLVAIVDEIRALLGIRAEDTGLPETR